jgi:CHAD domain-containing protein
MDFRSFVVARATRLLERLAYQINHSVNSRTPDAIHDLRVAGRRFGHSLIVGKPCLERRVVKKIRRRLDSIMDAAGAVRDCDIAIETVSRSKARGASAVEAKLRNQRAVVLRQMTGALDHWRVRKSLSKWRRELNREVPAYKPATVEHLAGLRLRRLSELFLHDGVRAARVEARIEDLHRFRLTAKKLRYTLELFGDVNGTSAAPWIDQLRSVQTLLGAINDCSVTRRIVEALDGSVGLVAALKRRERRLIAQFRAAWLEPSTAAGEAARRAQALSVPRKQITRESSPDGQPLIRQA